MYAVQFVVPDELEEEHHLTQFSSAAQLFQQIHDRQEHGIILLWQYDPERVQWVFQRGVVHVFTGKPGYYEIPERPDIDPPLLPVALLHRITDGFTLKAPHEP